MDAKNQRVAGLMLIMMIFVILDLVVRSESSVVFSSYGQRQLLLKPFDWTYLRVELPSSFSSVTMSFVSDVEVQRDQLKNRPKDELAVICLKDGNPPIPDISDNYLDSLLSSSFSNGCFANTKNYSNVERCLPFQENLTVVLTNAQIFPGVWYIGYFNGLGPARTQSKMISRGKAYKVSTNITIEGCPTSIIWGPYCNQTVNMISCSQPLRYNNSRRFLHSSVKSKGNLLSRWSRLVDKQVDFNSSISTRAENLITCVSSNESVCLGQGDTKFYFLDILDIALEFQIIIADFSLVQNTSSITQGNSSVLLRYYVRYNAFPLKDAYDYSGDISSNPLVVKLPKIGRWYIAVGPVNQTQSNTTEATHIEGTFCFSLEWQVIGCLNGKAGTNCSWETYMLQRIPKRGPAVPFESYYLPTDGKASIEYSHFLLEQLLSNSSDEQFAWTYFSLDIPQGAAGALIHIQLKSHTELNYELYSKYSALPSNESWDYYASRTSSSNGSINFSLHNSTAQSIDLFIFYAKEGTWCFGLKHPPNNVQSQTYMSISLEGCHKNCNENGACHYSVDESGMTFYSFCTCDRDHGGFDCSNELVSPSGHIWHSIFLIASNAAAILPAFWALRQKAFAEWILFTSSGISSALYHACDVGTWCILSFHVLQFLDFWLSFMAVVSTFIFMATIDEASKRAIHAAVFILTALLAATGATRSANIGIVIAIGTLGLLIGWLLEFSTSRRCLCWSLRIDLNMRERWQNIGGFFLHVYEILRKRFCWWYLLLGFVALALAATSWKLESNSNYWIWHSTWHITIYTSSFCFLCSIRVHSRNGIPEPNYELTRQDSLPREESRQC